jgi:outer membrane lipopolysaccharide assembly protein LptE/RlpB
MTRPGAARLRGVVAALTLGAALASAGCGYSFRGNLPAHLRTVAVPVFQNRTPVPAVENFLTSAVLNAFSANGRLRVATVDQADAILEGEITGYLLQSIAFDATANVRQYRLIVTLNLKFRDVRRNEVLFQSRGYSDRADFAVPGTVAETTVAVETATQDAATQIARSIVSFTVERF